MKIRQLKIIIGILFGLVLFASSVALLMYSKQTELNQYKKEKIEIYRAARTIYAGELLEAKDLQRGDIVKSYISFTPLTASEIIGRYATTTIFEKEPFRSEKISLSKPFQYDTNATQYKKTAEILNQESNEIRQLSIDTIALPLLLFQNIDSSLKQGDIIDIVSAMPKEGKDNYTAFDTKYIALSIPIASFLSNTTSLNRLVTKIDDKNIVQADTIVLEMSPKDIKNFLNVYYRTQALNNSRVYGSKENRGHLWIIKSAKNIDDKVHKEKEEMLLNRHTRVESSTPKKKVNIFYEN